MIKENVWCVIWMMSFTGGWCQHDRKSLCERHTDRLCCHWGWWEWKLKTGFWLRLNLFGSYGLHQWQILRLCKKWLLFVFWKHLIESQTLDPPSPALSLVTRDIYSCKASPTWCIYGHSSYNESCSQQDILARYLSIKRPKWVTAMIRLFAPSCLIRSN